MKTRLANLLEQALALPELQRKKVGSVVGAAVGDAAARGSSPGISSQTQASQSSGQGARVLTTPWRQETTAATGTRPWQS